MRTTIYGVMLHLFSLRYGQIACRRIRSRKRKVPCLHSSRRLQMSETNYILWRRDPPFEPFFSLASVMTGSRVSGREFGLSTEESGTKSGWITPLSVLRPGRSVSGRKERPGDALLRRSPFLRPNSRTRMSARARSVCGRSVRRS